VRLSIGVHLVMFVLGFISSRAGLGTHSRHAGLGVNFVMMLFVFILVMLVLVLTARDA
jgi:hypothetical protein